MASDQIEAIPFSNFTIIFFLFVQRNHSIQSFVLWHARICRIFLLFFTFSVYFLHWLVCRIMEKERYRELFWRSRCSLLPDSEKKGDSNISLWYIRMPDSKYTHKYSHKMNIYSLNYLNNNLLPLFSSHFVHHFNIHSFYLCSSFFTFLSHTGATITNFGSKFC